MAALPVSIGTDEAGALEYMGCSKFMFDDLRRAGVIVPVRKGWYSYALLDRAMQILETKALEGCKVIEIYAKETEGASKTRRGSVGSQGDGPGYRSSEELLREHGDRGVGKGV